MADENSDGDTRSREIFNVPGYRERASRQWKRSKVLQFARGAGESATRSQWVRLSIFRSAHPAEGEIRIEDRQPQKLTWVRNTATILPADATVRFIGGPCRVLHVMLEPSLFSDIATECAGDFGAVEWTFDLADPDVVKLANLVANEVDDDGFGDDLLAESLSTALAVRVLRHFVVGGRDETQRQGALSRERLRRVVDHIHFHYADSALSLHEMASVAALSTYQFGRSFKAAMAMSPHQFVLRHRIERAKHLMRTTDLSLVEIALATGFSSQAHFASRFRRVEGRTPTHYRHAAT